MVRGRNSVLKYALGVGGRGEGGRGREGESQAFALKCLKLDAPVHVGHALRARSASGPAALAVDRVLCLEGPSV